MSVTDHPMRLSLAGELHARPFPSVQAPCMAVYLALMADGSPVARDRARDEEGLHALLRHYGAPEPGAGAKHYFGEVGRGRLKWESHTEFTSYTFFLPLEDGSPFDPSYFDVFPDDWLTQVQGKRLTSALIRIDSSLNELDVDKTAGSWFVSESLAAARLHDGGAIVLGDFRVDTAGHMRFAVFTSDTLGARRTGRIVQRLAEVETYKAAAMIGFLETAPLGAELESLEEDLTRAVSDMRNPGRSEEALDQLLSVATALEERSTHSSFRFGATEAYAKIVTERIGVLREDRFQGRQSFREFMLRRFEPAMRTVRARETRLRQLSERAARAAELLRTKVDVARSAENQALLASMDRRADLQLRLQKTVEGLSVVAISYYAVNLMAYLLAPVAPISKPTLTGALVLPVAAAVWLILRRIKKSVH